MSAESSEMQQFETLLETRDVTRLALSRLRR